tara:strand:+ start:38 stop:397 length:360 start_codon:yes stop_codon:yes gene_type:complete
MKDKAFAVVYKNEHGQDVDELFLTLSSAYDYMKEHNCLDCENTKVHRIEFELKEVPNFYDDDIQEEVGWEMASAQEGGYSRDHFRSYDAITDMTDFNKDAEKHTEEFRKYSKEINNGIN